MFADFCHLLEQSGPAGCIKSLVCEAGKIKQYNVDSKHWFVFAHMNKYFQQLMISCSVGVLS